MPRISARRLWNATLVYGGLGVFMALIVASVVIVTTMLVMAFVGDAAWPCGVIIGLLLVALIWMHMQHQSELRHERIRYRDLQESQVEFYS